MGQIGQTSLAVVPTMKGMRKLVSAEAKASVKQAGRVIESDFGKSGVKAGRSLSDGFKAGSRGGVDAIKLLSRENAAATQAWSRDNRQHQDALGRVRVAQAQLTESVSKYGAESAKSISAQERLAAAQRRVEETGARVASSFDKMKGAQSALKTATDAATAAGEQQGSRLGRVWQSIQSGASTAASGIGRVFGPVWEGIKSGAAAAGKFIGDSIKVGAAVAGIAVTGLLAKMVAGGWNRLTSIENAQAKMKGLGFAADDIKAAMDGASDAVDGTAFSLDEMASVASVAMAAGLKPGAELNSYMATLKNAAAAANVPLSEMGGIMNKVVTGQKAYTAEIEQIAQRGLPIWSKLQEAYGVTAEELKKMVSNGEVDAATFFKVMDEMTGSVADAMGNTTQAKIKNFGTALNKLGADVLAGLYPVIGPVFDALKAGVQMIQAVVAPAFAGLGDSVTPLSEKLQAFTDKWAEIKAKISEGGDPLALIQAEWPKFGAFLEKLQGMVEKLPELVDGLAGTFGTLGAALGPVAEKLGPILAEAIKTLMDALAPLLPELGETLLNAVVELAPPLVDLLAALVPLIPPLTELLVAVLPVVAAIADLLIPVLGFLVDQLAPVFEGLSQLISYFKGDIGADGFIENLLAIGGGFGDMIAGVVQAGIQVGMVMANIGNFMRETGANIRDIWNGVGSFLQGLWATVATVAVTVWNSIRTGITTAINMAAAVIATVLTGIRNTWTSVWNGIVSFFSGIVSGIRNAIGNIGSAVVGIKDTIMNTLGNIGSWLVDSGRALIQGFIDGIKGMIGAAGDAAGGVVDWVRGFFPNSPAKRGPLSGAGWRSLRESGGAYITQWTDGITAGARAFELSDAIDSGPGALLVGAGSSTGSSPAAASSAKVTNNIKIDMFDRDPRIVAKQIGRGIEEALV